MSLAWYAAETHVQSERAAEERLRGQGFEPVLLTCITRRVFHHRVIETVQPLFPRYLLMPLDLDGLEWRRINNTPGVRRLLGPPDHPTSIKSGVVEELIRRCGNEPVRDPGILINSVVRVLGGPFSDELGKVVGTARGRVHVLLSFFNRQMPVELDPVAVEVVGRA